jgi:ABC-type nickel/cobalt efflux system permease component RcnA
MIPMDGISFFSIVVLFQFFIVETLSEKLPFKKLHPFIKSASSAVILFTGIYYIVKFTELFILRINQ